MQIPRQPVNTAVPHRPAFGFLLTSPTSRSVSQSCLWCGLQTSRKLCFTPGSSSRGLDSQFRNCFSWTSPLTGASNRARPNWTPCFSSTPGLPSVCRVHVCPSPAARNSRAHLMFPLPIGHQTHWFYLLNTPNYVASCPCLLSLQTLIMSCLNCP